MAVRRVRIGVAAITAALLLAAAGCGSANTPTLTSAPTPSSPLPLAHLITIGDVDADEPIKKIKRFQPLADYLAENLRELGIQGGQIVIATDVDQMGRFLKNGTVDIFFDSPFPALLAQKLSGSHIILRRWKQSEPKYWTVFIARRDSDVSRVEDFVGRVLALEEPNSTSGFVLPAGTLVQLGYNIREILSPEAVVKPGEIGYFFSRDEENTIELVLAGRVAGGAISNLDYGELPSELMDQLVSFDRTISLPRQLVSVRPGLDPSLVSKVRELLMGLENTEEGRQLLDGLKRTKRFDPLPKEAEATLQQLTELMQLVPGK